MKKRKLVQLVVSAVTGILFVSCKTSKALTAPDTAIRTQSIVRTAVVKKSDPDLNPGSSLSPVISSAQYSRLQQAMSSLASIRDEEWDVIAYPKASFKQGHSAPVISQVKKKLHLLGDLKSDDTSPLFTNELEMAVRDFQKRFGLKEDGIINKAFIDEINIPISARVNQVAVNMERAKTLQMPSSGDYLVINVPEFMLRAYNNNEMAFDMPVIVGKAGSSTVLFNDRIKNIVFSPYWNVPPSIVRNEILPGMRSGGHGYLAARNMEVVGTEDGLPKIRQRPGPSNSLGRVKFVFPNSYNIYLHDTPDKPLFDRVSRSFSHGCIRLKEPDKLAEFLLRNQKGYDYAKINELMNRGEETSVNLKTPVPVFIVYFTSWVDSDGKLNFRKDIYNHDRKMPTDSYASK